MISCLCLFASRVLLLSIGITSFAITQPASIRILSAKFGDTHGDSCVPNLSICDGKTVCEFVVGEMCSVKGEAKNLEVSWDCGPDTPKKARAAAKGTKISIACPIQQQKTH
jgi:hypothetical protein